jgi:invasion protein IalB
VPFDDWRVICPPPGQTANPCTLNMDVLRDTGGTLMSMVLDNPNPGSVLAVTVPHGVALDSGIGFAAGNDPLTVRPYETCTSAGCIAFVTLDGNLLKSMSSNMKGNVVVALPGNTNPVSVPFSLKGFSQGYAELQRAKARRDSIFAFLDR